VVIESLPGHLPSSGPAAHAAAEQFLILSIFVSAKRHDGCCALDMLPTHDVPCPRCGKPLYSATSLEDAVIVSTPESPKVENDDGGYYLRCPACGGRMPMERLEHGGRAAWRPRV
jgi:DNA-directed RNA polymerase subunit RPC12/RpoP